MLYNSINVNILSGRTTTSINGKKDNDLKSIINQIIDFKEKETEIICVETKDINIYTETVQKLKQYEN